ncbi:MAG TPA: hypothetical protein VGK19_01365 [Capsulimonadaceae bacterium]|jgi:hypothetical protein
MTAANERDRASSLAPIDNHAALLAARKVTGPWYRCQSLAAVARYCPAKEVERIADEAVKTAKRENDVYRQVAPCAWVVRALIERNRFAHAERLVGELLTQLTGDIHPVCRVDALDILFEAAWPYPPCRRRVLVVLVDACCSTKSWRAGRLLAWVSLLVANEDRAEGQRILDRMSDTKHKRQAQRQMGQPLKYGVRGFFHYRPGDS